MSIVEQITKNLMNPDKHGPILKALVDILEEEGEKAAKDRIKKWVEEIQAETTPSNASEE